MGGGDLEERRRRLQDRIDRALSVPSRRAGPLRFSPYLPQDPEPLRRLTTAASAGGLEGLEAAMDEFDRLGQDLEPGEPEEMWWTLNVFLAHYPTGEAGIRVPSVVEQAPDRFRPGFR